MKTYWFGLVPVLGALCLAATAQDITSGQNVAEVRIGGLERISEQVVRAQLEVQAGQPLNPRAIARDIRRLYELGHFSNIRVDAVPAPNGVSLTYVVEEKRVIDEIKIIGNDKLKERRIRGVLSWREGDAFLPEGYDGEREAILALYQEKGFANASVDIIAEKVGPSRVRLTYVIHEGRKARIRSIRFVGNEALARGELQKIMQTRRAFWFIGGRFDEDKFEADLQNIVSAYGDEGRLEAQVPRTEIEYTDGGKSMHITVYLEEGPQYSVATLDVANNVVYDDDEVRGIIAVHEGDVHNRSQVQADAALVQQGYQDSGYVDAQVTPQVVLDREAKTTHVVHDVAEGDLKYIREVEITGNEVTKDDVVRRQMLLSPGDRFDGSLVKLSQRRLDGTGYFEQTRITLGNVIEDDLWTDLLVDVEEGKTGSFNFGVGYSTEDRFGGFGELRLTNVDITNWPTFSGGGQRLNLRLQLGDRRDQYSVSFTDPEVFGYPLLFGFDVYDESRRFFRGSDYREDQFGAQVRLGKVLSPFVRTTWNALYQDTDISDVPLQFIINPELRELTGSSSTLSLGWNIERDTVDNARDPQTGAMHSFQLQVAGFGQDNEFVKLEHDSQFYWPLSEDRRWVLSYRTREGWVTPYGSSDYVPLQDRYFAGGSTTIRGYDSRDVGPKVREFIFWGDKTAIGGELRLLNNLEVKYKVTDIFRLYGFVDAGGVWREASDFDFDGFRASVGLGIGFDVPRLGPFRLDYGFPLNPDSDQGSGRLHLATGFRF